jgi:lipopolysaccharide transport system permease protein
VSFRAEVAEMFNEQVEYRELLYQMTRRDLLLRYKQTIMGFGWAIFMPLLNTIIFSVVFTQVAHLDVGVPYPVFSYTGLLAWNFFASSLRFSVSALTANINLVAKVYFPREIFPFSAVVVGAVDFAVGAILLVGLLIYYRIPITPAVLFLPVVILIEVIFTAGMALWLAMANMFFRDVKYLFEVVITLWMFATSVLYPVDKFGGWIRVVISLNPMTPVIDAYRAILLRGTLPAPVPLAAATAIACVVLAAGWLTFHRSEYRFAELL